MATPLRKRKIGITDIETLGVNKRAPVLEASFLDFCIEDDHHTRYEDLLDRVTKIPFGMQHQLDLGRKIDASTLLFWLTQGDAAKKAVLEKSLQLQGGNADNLAGLSRLGRACDNIICRYPSFDDSILETLRCDYGIAKPLWDHWVVKDITTFLLAWEKESEAKAFKEKAEKDGWFIKHDSAHDVAMDAFIIIHSFWGDL